MRGVLSVTVVVAGVVAVAGLLVTLSTVVPGAMPGPLTGIPAPIPVPVPNVSVDARAASGGVAVNGGMTYPWVSASRSSSR